MAAVVWNEDFGSGFSNWTVEEGDWRVTDGYLESYFVDSTDSLIWHSSSQTVGTWSFDAYVVDMSIDNRFENDYMFMINETESTSNYYGYGIRFSGDGGVYLVRQSGGFTSQTSLRFIINEDLVLTWVHVDVTRSATGTFNVFLNADSTTAQPNITVTDTTYDYSEKFIVYGVSNGATNCKFDNVSVNSEILISAPEQTTTTTEETSSTATSGTDTGTDTGAGFDMTLVIAGTGVAAVVVIAVVVIVKRR